MMKTAGTTLACLFLVLAYGLGIFGFLAPAPMVRLTDEMGLQRAASMFQERVYRRDPTRENIMLALDRFIDADRHNKVIEFAEKLFAYDETTLVTPRIRDAYVASLLAHGRVNDALGFVDYATLPINLLRPCFVFFILDASDQLTDQQREDLRQSYLVYVLDFRNTPTTNDMEHAIMQLFILRTQDFYNSMPRS